MSHRRPPDTFGLTWPLLADGLFRMSATLGTTWIISCISDAAAATAGMAQIFFMFGFNLCECMAQSLALLLTQELGGGRAALVGGLYRLGLRLSLIVGAIIALLLFLGGPALLATMASGTDTSSGAWYLRVIAIGFPVHALNYAMLYFLNAHGFSRATMLNALTINCMHFALSFIAVKYFSVSDFQKLLFVGASQLVVRFLGLAANSLACRRYLTDFGWNSVGFDVWRPVRRVLHIFSALVGESLSYQLFNFAIAGVIAALGTPALAARSYVIALMGVFESPAAALARGNQVVVGHYVGSQNKVGARQYALQVALVGMCMSITSGALLFVARKPLMAIFSQDPLIREIGEATLFIASLLVAARGVTANFAASLRGSGDTSFAFATTLGGIWCVSFPLSLLATRFSALGLAGVWTAMVVDELCRGVILLKRLRSEGFGRKNGVEIARRF